MPLPANSNLINYIANIRAQQQAAVLRAQWLAQSQAQRQIQASTSLNHQPRNRSTMQILNTPKSNANQNQQSDNTKKPFSPRYPSILKMIKQVNSALIAGTPDSEGGQALKETLLEPLSRHIEDKNLTEHPKTQKRKYVELPEESRQRLAQKFKVRRRLTQ
ncbi:hypothetical protein H072_10220 [Dactylellina haptotyla CBS 200.50]|uniref:Uncharacterized protein n=1 Tax=Dactylellina haptotyla (strain CBS 200.50) TaxID=1284197 RepID=S8BAV9_DACHA|nr:hypothetical protein H072_10220 [Dactylellina haptotyla CBS 200.50]